ncbi:MAG TPA: peptidylprolyl isomerase, partial [Acidimicrobiia bacterium]|nr:peptidylprolyl isomerase [Acidimicrobiia bacterium]
MKTRRLALAVVVAAGGGLLAACTGTAPYSAIVNGTRLSQATLSRELHSLGGNAAFVSSYDQSITQSGSSQQPVFAADTGGRTYTQGFTAVVLNTDIQAQLIHDEVVRRHIQPSAADINNSATTAAQQFPTDPQTNKSVFDSFDGWFKHEYEVRAAEQAALQKALPAVATDTAAVKKFYADNPADFITTECVSHILVATEQKATELRDRLAGGADFATLAAQNSTDTASAVKGGA